MKKNIQLNFTFVILILLAVVLGCSDSDGGNSGAKTPEKEIPAAYVGMWTGADGSTLTIRNDGSGDYKSGGSSMSGGSVEVDEAAKEIRFSLLLFDSKYKIDEPPKGNKMKLDGMEYRRTGGFDTSDEQKDKAAEMPSENELQTLAGETLKNFGEAIQQGDFTDFHSTVSEVWKKKITVADFQKAFADAVREKADYTLKPDAPLNFTSEPELKNEGETFDVKGNYPTAKGTKVAFRLTYVKETDGWKLLGIYVNPDNVPEKKK